MSYPIEKGVPVPAGMLSGGATKYPFMEMEMGDSFFVPLNGKDSIRVINNIAQCNYVRCRERKFARRTVIENGVHGVRCWRMADRDQVDLKVVRAA